MGRDRTIYVTTELRGRDGEYLGAISTAYYLRAGMTVYVCREQPERYLTRVHAYVQRETWPGDVRALVNVLDLFPVASARKPA